MLKEYTDTSFFRNPLLEYFKWISRKIFYQTKYWGSHLRIGYKAVVLNCEFGKYNWIQDDTYIVNSKLGDLTYVAKGANIFEANIGKYCSIGPNVRIAPGNHPLNKIISTHPSIYSKSVASLKSFAPLDKFESHKRVIVGNDVWICANAIIIDGITIGDGAVIASNSVVTKDVAPYSMVGGTPAKHIKYRFEKDEIDQLLADKWWDKDFDWLKQNIETLWDIRTYLDGKE